MTIKHAIGSLRRYGIRGVIDFALALPKKRAFSRRMAKTMISDPDWKPTPGITVIGDLSGNFSLPKSIRDLVFRLRACGIPCQALDIGDKHQIPESEYAHLLTPANEFRVNRYTDIIGMLAMPCLPRMAGVRSTCLMFWEFDSGLCEHYPHFSDPGIREVAAMSDYDLKVFRNLLPPSVHVSKILYPFQFKPHLTEPRESVRARYGIAPDDFAVFFNFAYPSSLGRKNPDGAACAFAEAFADRHDAKLVFKTSGAERCPNSVTRLKAFIGELGIADRVIFIDNYFIQDEIVALTDACDAYLSLHRGEGLGIGIVEAMSLGLPVVVANNTAPTEFCKAENTMLVPCETVPVRKEQVDIPDYDHVKTWNEPDIHAAAAALRRLYDDRAFARELGERGRRFVADYFSDANFKKSIEAFLARP